MTEEEQSKFKLRFDNIKTQDITMADIVIETILLKCRREKRDRVDTVFMLIDELATRLNEVMKPI